MKQRLTYADFVAAKQKEEGTVAWLIEKYIAESEQPGGRPLGNSSLYSLRKLQRSSLAQKKHEELKALDFIDHCKGRKAVGIKPQTINHDVTLLRTVLRHAVEVWELSEAGLEACRKAKPQLVKQQLISKAQSRDRRPTPEEFERILEACSAHDARPRARIVLRPIVEFSVYSARRLGETCRLRWGDVDTEKRLCLVRDLKNPNGKGFHDTFPLLGRAWEIVLAQPRLDPSNPDERIFPYNAHSVSACYVAIKHELGIKNLRLHDNRREAISRLFEQGYNVPEVSKVSLHRNPSLLLKTYTSLKPEDLHRGPASKRVAA